uniref:Uncharacterized protein n=1 Tax=viral metagenome TaxID=1070528 RepID=A0A6C0C4E8_9ZZZZ
MNNNIFINPKLNTYKHGGGKIHYPIKLKTNFKNINITNESSINICIYRINNQEQHKPFLQYLLYKFDKPDIISFPFKKIKQKDNPKNIADKLAQKLLNYKIESMGYIISNDIFYFFYKDNTTLTVSNKFKNDKLWWCLIDEICNHNQVLNFPIHKKCYQLFYKNPSLIYLKKNKRKLDIPIIAYYGDTIELINYIASLGLRASQYRTFGPYYYFSSYIKSIAWGGWTSNYKKRLILNKKITDDNGKYKQGGLIRFALFLDKHYVMLYQKNDLFYKFIDNLNNIDKKSSKKLKNIKLFDWTNQYNSLVLGNIKYKNLSGYFNINTEYVVKDFNQQIVLSTHEIDTKTLKTNWDPLYKKYLIK